MNTDKEKKQPRRTKPNTTQIWNQRTPKALLYTFNNFPFEIKLSKEAQWKNLELKSSTPKMKSSLDVLNNVFIGDGSMNLKTDKQKLPNLKKKKKKLSNM